MAVRCGTGGCGRERGRDDGEGGAAGDGRVGGVVGWAEGREGESGGGVRER